MMQVLASPLIPITIYGFGFLYLLYSLAKLIDTGKKTWHRWQADKARRKTLYWSLIVIEIERNSDDD